MKKITAVLLSMVLVLGMFGISAFAAGPSTQVYVTIAAGDGKLAIAQEAVAVTDIDNDGKITINDALYCAHAAFYPGGASAGYATVLTDWGIGIKKLWNVVNGGSYGYYVNNESAFSLTDPIAAGDYVNAFAYKDAQGFSDSYSYFSKQTVNATLDTSFDLTLYRLAFDANFNTVETPVAGAVITLDGSKTDFVTDANGKVTITLAEEGTHVISAQSDSIIIVAPVCTVEVSQGGISSMFSYLLQMAMSFIGVIVSFFLGLFGMVA